MGLFQLKLNNSLEREFYTTNNEKLFTLKREDISEIKNNYKFANLLFFCNVNSNKPVSKYVKEILTEQAVIISDSLPTKMIAAKDFWAQNQTVVFILGKDVKSVLLYTFENLNQLFDIFKNREIERLKNLIYLRGLNKKVIEYEKANYPWTLKLPKGYIVFRRDSKNNFVSYLLRVKKYPDRFLAVLWEKMQEDKVSKKWLWNKRLEIGEKYYAGDEFYAKDVIQRKIEFASYNGYKLYGRWQNPENCTGGAFASFAFYDKQQKIAYLLIILFFFPKEIS